MINDVTQKDIIQLKTYNHSHKDEMYLFIKLTDKCNFSCNYCNLHDPEAKTEHSAEVIVSVIKNILLSLPKTYKRIIYHIYGGEPTVHKQFKKIISMLIHITKDIEFRIEIKTNFSRSKDFFKDITILHSNVRLICSYQNHQQLGKLNDYISKLLFLKDSIDCVDVMLENPSLYNSSIKDIKEITYLLKESQIPFQLNPIDDIEPDGELKELYIEFKNDDDQMLIITKDNKFKINVGDILINYNNFFGFWCDVGKTQFLLNFSKPIYKISLCYQDDIQNKPIWNSEEDIDLIKERISSKNKVTRCLHQKCLCEIFINKNRKKEE